MKVYVVSETVWVDYDINKVHILAAFYKKDDAAKYIQENRKPDESPCSSESDCFISYGYQIIELEVK